MADRKISKNYQNILNIYGATKVNRAEVGPIIKIIDNQWDPDPDWTSLEDIIKLCIEKDITPGIQLFAIEKKFWKNKNKAFFYSFLSFKSPENSVTSLGNDVYIFSKIISPLRELILAWDNSSLPNDIIKARQRISKTEIQISHTDNEIHFSTNNIIANRRDISNNLLGMRDLILNNNKMQIDISNNINELKKKTNITDIKPLEQKIKNIEDNLSKVNDVNNNIINKLNILSEKVSGLFDLLTKKL
tara:strand:- start:973 stop:1710 length:738 start_codon:yes stop_codon:yes gene_type:complete